MTSQIRIQIITIHMFPNISRSKDNHAMKFCQLIKYNGIFSSKNHAENEPESLVADLVWFF